MESIQRSALTLAHALHLLDVTLETILKGTDR